MLGYSEINKNQPVAIIAREQFSGFGQNSKTWVSPKGGIWLSAAYPIFSKEFVKVIGSASKTVFYLKKIQGPYPSWTLHYKIKCKSTENELTNLLGYSEIKKYKPVAIICLLYTSPSPRDY